MNPNAAVSEMPTNIQATSGALRATPAKPSRAEMAATIKASIVQEFMMMVSPM
jgi:hypothetical protein